MVQKITKRKTATKRPRRCLGAVSAAMTERNKKAILALNKCDIDQEYIKEISSFIKSANAKTTFSTRKGSFVIKSSDYSLSLRSANLFKSAKRELTIEFARLKKSFTTLLDRTDNFMLSEFKCRYQDTDTCLDENGKTVMVIQPGVDDDMKEYFYVHFSQPTKLAKYLKCILTNTEIKKCASKASKLKKLKVLPKKPVKAKKEDKTSKIQIQLMEKVKTWSRSEVLTNWIKKSKPCAYRYGFAYRGAGSRIITKEDALSKFDRYSFGMGFYELRWEMRDNKVTLVFNEYSESDMW